MNITLDIAAALSAVIWPAIALLLLIAYLSQIPMFVDSLSVRFKKL